MKDYLMAAFVKSEPHPVLDTGWTVIKNAIWMIPISLVLIFVGFGGIRLAFGGDFFQGLLVGACSAVSLIIGLALFRVNTSDLRILFRLRRKGKRVKGKILEAKYQHKVVRDTNLSNYKVRFSYEIPDPQGGRRTFNATGIADRDHSYHKRFKKGRNVDVIYLPSQPGYSTIDWDPPKDAEYEKFPEATF